MTLHIGIVACSAEGATLCYRTICQGGESWLGPYGHPEVSFIDDSDSALLTLDSTGLLARAALQRATATEKS